MGKPTGFIDYEREDAKAIEPKERIKNFKEFHIPLPWKTAGSGRKMHELRCAVLPVRYDHHGNDKRMSAAQSGTGVE